jgi:SnoaL-like domain
MSCTSLSETPNVTTEDWVALHQLFAIAAAAGDARDIHGFLACFTLDARITHAGRDPLTGRDLGHQSGREEIRRAREALPSVPTRRHVLSNLRVTGRPGGDFTTEQTVLVAATTAHGCGVARIASYVDRVVRGHDSVLRIAERTIVFDEPRADDITGLDTDERARLEVLEARFGVETTLSQYGQGITRKDRELWLGVFTDDACLTISYRGSSEAAVDLCGRDELRRWYDEHEVDWPPGTETQLTVGPRITIDGDQARATSTFVVAMVNQAGMPALRTLGTYDDDLRRTDDGRWRIARRRVTTTTRPASLRSGAVDAAL